MDEFPQFTDEWWARSWERWAAKKWRGTPEPGSAAFWALEAQRAMFDATEKFALSDEFWDYDLQLVRAAMAQFYERKRQWPEYLKRKETQANLVKGSAFLDLIRYTNKLPKSRRAALRSLLQESGLLPSSQTS